jgi:hypothetical protein
VLRGRTQANHGCLRIESNRRMTAACSKHQAATNAGDRGPVALDTLPPPLRFRTRKETPRNKTKPALFTLLPLVVVAVLKVRV